MSCSRIDSTKQIGCTVTRGPANLRRVCLRVSRRGRVAVPLSTGCTPFVPQPRTCSLEAMSSPCRNMFQIAVLHENAVMG